MTRIAGWARQFGVARAVCLVLLFALIPLRLADPRPLEELRLRTFDFYQVLRPRVQDGYPVVIVDIDEASLKAIGQWPWPRTTVADLVTRITQLGAVVIGFDIIFAEPDRMSPAIAEQSFRGIDADTRAKLDSLPSNDDVLADAIKHSRVVVGEAGAATPTPTPPGEAALQTGFAVRGPNPAPYLVTFPGILRNVPAIEKAAAGRGLFSINPERDGIIRLRTGDHGGARRVGALAHHGDAAGRHPIGRHSGARQRCRRAVRGGTGSRSADRSERSILGAFQQARSGPLRLGQGRAARHRAGGSLSRPARPHRHLGDRPARPQDDAGRGGDARRRSACSNPRKRLEQVATGPSGLRHRRRADGRGVDRSGDHRCRADVVGDRRRGPWRRLSSPG